MPQAKRKALIISYIWPPMEGVGLIRVLKFSKYMQEFGWKPVVLTVKTPSKNADTGRSSNSGGIKVFRTDYRDVIGNIKEKFRRAAKGSADIVVQDENTAVKKKSAALTSFVRDLIAMPDEQIGWYNFAVEEGRKIVPEENIDLIFSTSPPETSHLIARRLKKHFDIPWVADFRDLWSDDHYRERPLFKKMLLRSMEKRTLKDADAIITVSEPWAKKLGGDCPVRRGRISVIENGFDEEDFNAFRYEGNDKFTITYTGKLHSAYQDTEAFFRALSGLVREGRIDRNKIAVNFYLVGHRKPDINKICARHGLAGIVKDMGGIGYAPSLEAQRSSDLLLFVQWRGEGGDGWYSAKLYDYIGARRPILAMAEPGGIIDEMIKRTSSGVAADDDIGLKEAILKFYDEYIRAGQVRYEGSEKEIAKCTRRLRAEELAGLFNSLVDAKK